MRWEAVILSVQTAVVDLDSAAREASAELELNF
jgi:hypothetical protein